MADEAPVDLDAPILPDEPSNSDVSETTDENWLDEPETDKSETAEDNEETSEDTDKESDDSSEEAKTEEAEESTDEDSEEQSDDDTKEETPDQKEQARQRYLERQARRQEADPYVDSIKKEAEERLAGIEDDTQRKLANLEVKDRLREIQDARTNLLTDHEFARRDHEVFNPTSKEFNESAYNTFLGDYESAWVVTDPETKQVIGTRDGAPSLYQYLSDKAELIASLKQVGARENQTSKAKMKSQAVTPSVAAPKEAPKDKFAEAFDSEF